MNICILTVIKDEQRYLKEWIEYHHNLSIDNFILVEDYNSTSHKEICDQYNYVELYKIDDYLNSDDIKWYEKNTPTLHRQIVTFRHFILKNRELHKYDYLLFLDVDEFVVFKSTHTNIKDLCNELEKNPNIVYLRINWKFATCTDPFKKMPYNYNVFNTYDIELNNDCKHVNTSKMIINLSAINKIQLTYEILSIFPHMIKLTNTNSSQNININTCYIKHCMTKTWDEWLYRLIKRGEPQNKKHLNRNRKFEDFFKINRHIKKDIVNEKLEDIKNLNVTINTYEKT